MEEEFEDHQHHVLLAFELVSQDLSFFFFDTAVRTDFIENLLVSLNLLLDWFVKDRAVQILYVTIDLAAGFYRHLTIRHRLLVAQLALQHAVIPGGCRVVKVVVSIHVTHT